MPNLRVSKETYYREGSSGPNLRQSVSDGPPQRPSGGGGCGSIVLIGLILSAATVALASWR